MVVVCPGGAFLFEADQRAKQSQVEPAAFIQGFESSCTDAFFSRSASNFLKSSRSRSGARSVSLAVCFASFQPAFTAFWSNSIARSAYSFFLSAILVLASE